MKKVIFVLIAFVAMAGVLSPVAEVQVAKAQGLNEIVENQLLRLDNSGLPGDADEGRVLDDVVKLVQLLLGTVAIIFFILILWAGFRWMTSGGNQETVDKAKKMITSALIGLLVIVFSYAITVFVFRLVLETAKD